MIDSKEILAVGSIAFDSIKTFYGERKKILGGSSTYFGIAASRYAKTSLIGIVGEDFTDEYWNIFKEHKIKTDSVIQEKGNTFSWGGEYNKDFSKRNTIFTKLGVFKNFKPQVSEDYDKPILYLGNIQPQLQLDVIKKIKSPHLVAADSMNLWIDLYPKLVWELLSRVDIFMLNDEEAKQLTSNNDLNKIADILLSHGPEIIIIKKGSLGSLLAYKDKQINISVVPNIQVVDPTGAGDSFAGGLLGYIANNGLNNPEQAVIHGSAIASYTVSGFGLDKLYSINKNDLQDKIKSIKWS